MSPTQPMETNSPPDPPEKEDLVSIDHPDFDPSTPYRVDYISDEWVELTSTQDSSKEEIHPKHIGHIIEKYNPDVPDQLKKENVSLIPYEEYHNGPNRGSTIQYMEVGYTPSTISFNNAESFFTNIGPRQADKTYAERAICAAQFFSNIGHPQFVPQHHFNRQDNYLAVDAVNGTRISEGKHTEAPIQKSEYLNFASINLMLGNTDTHRDNVLITPDNELKIIDLKDTIKNISTNKKARDRTLSYIIRTGEAISIDITRQEIIENAKSLIEERPIDDLLKNIENGDRADVVAAHQYERILRENIEYIIDTSITLNTLSHNKNE